MTRETGERGPSSFSEPVLCSSPSNHRMGDEGGDMKRYLRPWRELKRPPSAEAAAAHYDAWVSHQRTTAELERVKAQLQAEEGLAEEIRTKTDEVITALFGRTA